MKNVLVMLLALGLLVTSAHLVFAQDAPAANEPAAEPAPAAPDQAAPAAPPDEAAPAAPPAEAAPAEAPPADTTTETTTETTMPHTASPLPLIGLSGLAAFGTALALRLRRK